MTVSVKMLADIALHAQAMADEAKAMAEAMQAVVDDCAEQLAAKAEENGKPGAAGAASSVPTKEPEWVAQAEAAPHEALPLPESESVPVKQYTIAEVRAYVAERTNHRNREQIRAILHSFGVAKLTELSADKYPALMKEVAKL